VLSPFVTSVRRSELSGPIAFLLIGTLFRLVWPADMEWKGDEQWMFAHAVAIAQNGVLPWLGMTSGAHIMNPGFSIWPFAFFARFSSNPVAMVQWVQWSNVIALWGFFWLFVRGVPLVTRNVWLWGLALFAVSPFPVLYSRKIWAQDLLPIFGAATLWGHFYRRTRLGAFAWGLAGALIGQIHMSGFFFAFALACVTVVRDTRRGELGATRWMYWIAGSLIGGALLLPWLSALGGGNAGHSVYRFSEILTLNYYIQWLLAAWGLGLATTRYGGLQFLRAPFVSGHATYLMLLAHTYLAAIGAWMTLRWLASWLPRRFGKKLASELGPRFDERLTFYFVVTLGVVGVLLTLSGVRIRPHYLLVVAPFIHVWAAAVAWPRKRLLVSVAAAQMLVTATLLMFVHVEGGVPGADYGRSYRAQQASGVPNLTPPGRLSMVSR
jgi:hypothetical protein